MIKTITHVTIFRVLLVGICFCVVSCEFSESDEIVNLMTSPWEFWKSQGDVSGFHCFILQILFCCVFAGCTKHFMKCDELLLIKTSSYQRFQKANLKHLLNSTICHVTDVRCGLVNVVQITEHYWTLIKHLGWWMSSYVSVFVCLLLVAFVMPWVAMRETVFCNYSVAYFDFSACSLLST